MTAAHASDPSSAGSGETEGRLSASEEDLTARGRTRAPEPFRPRRVEKPWGYELIWAQTDVYVGKLLFVRAGEALSLQFHEEKDETLFLLRGRLRFLVGPGLDALVERKLDEGEAIRIEPATLHRIEAVTDVELVEVSTPELDDVVRIQDRYGRAGE
jgi:mannose-6-phosphate isomerase